MLMTQVISQVTISITFWRIKRQYTVLSAREVLFTQGDKCRISSFIDNLIFFSPKIDIFGNDLEKEIYLFLLSETLGTPHTTFKRYDPDISNIFCNVKSPFDF